MLGIAIISCNNDDSYNIGESYFDINTNIRYVDTFSVTSYTVALDSIGTSGYSKALVGMYNDDEFGTIASRSYFQLGVPSSYSIPDDAVFDSVNLMMIPDGYSIGDTTLSYGIKLYELSENISLAEDLTSLYNTNSFSVKPDIIGSISIVPRPNTFDSIKIPVDKELGEDLFIKLIEDDDVVSDNSNFIDYKKGFLLESDENNVAALRYEATDTTLFLRLYYHYVDYEITNDFVDFPLYNTDLQFNEITRQNSEFDTISSQREMLSSSETNNQTFIQAGSPLVTRIEFRNIKKLLELYNNVNILSVELVIKPVKGSYYNKPLPGELVLYETDRLNQFGDEILALDGSSSQTGNLVEDYIFHEETNYSFNITTFLEEKITTVSDESPAMLITIPANDLYISLDRCIIGSCNNKENQIKLKIYYMDYE